MAVDTYRTDRRCPGPSDDLTILAPGSGCDCVIVMLHAHRHSSVAVTTGGVGMASQLTTVSAEFLQRQDLFSHQFEETNAVLLLPQAS